MKKTIFLITAGLSAQTSVDWVTQLKNYPIPDARTYNFPKQTPGGSLSAGSNTITLKPSPAGVKGSATNYYLYISGGSGAAESAKVTGGSCGGTFNSGNCTVIVTCANSHGGSWSIASATNGASEALNALNMHVLIPHTVGVDQTNITSQLSDIVTIDLRDRVSPGYNTKSYITIRGNSAVPERTLTEQLPPPYTQNLENFFTVGVILPSGSNSYETNAISATCDNYGGGWPSTQNACVAFKSFVRSQAPNSPVWGANFVAGTTPGNDASITGLEIDMGNYTADDTGSGARKNALQLSGGGQFNLGDATVINCLGCSTGKGWTHGIHIEASALATNGQGIRIDAPGNANPNSGMVILGNYSDSGIRMGSPGTTPIKFNSQSSTDGAIGTDGSNNLILQYPNAGNLYFTNSVLTTWQMKSAPGTLVSGGTVFGNLGTPTSGAMIWCANCAVATTCISGGSGAWAFANGSRWTCPF